MKIIARDRGPRYSRIIITKFQGPKIKFRKLLTFKLILNRS